MPTSQDHNNYYGDLCQGLYIILQMDCKRYIITLAKNSTIIVTTGSVPGMSDSTVTILYKGATTFNMAV